MVLGYEHLLTPELIWNIKQNKPSLIADDLQVYGVPPDVTHTVLLARGVYKWLSVRRKLISTKNEWKKVITGTIEQIKICKSVPDNAYSIGYWRGYLRAYEECRANIRALCHSERWQAPDFDRQANDFLNKRLF